MIEIHKVFFGKKNFDVFVAIIEPTTRGRLFIKKITKVDEELLSCDLTKHLPIINWTSRKKFMRHNPEALVAGLEF